MLIIVRRMSGTCMIAGKLPCVKLQEEATLMHC